MAITNFARNAISESRPMSACQRVTSVFDLKLSAGSSERDQRILAASRSARWTLIHRERKGGLNGESIYADLDQSFCDLHVCFQKLLDCLNM